MLCVPWKDRITPCAERTRAAAKAAGGRRAWKKLVPIGDMGDANGARMAQDVGKGGAPRRSCADGLYVLRKTGVGRAETNAPSIGWKGTTAM